MINWKEVPVPSRIQNNCIKDKRGLYAPYIVTQDDNDPIFTINDSNKVVECVIRKRCTICGDKLGDDIWFIGGPASAFHVHGAFNDPAVHKECGIYALKVCPYLAYANYNSKLNFKKMQEKYKGRFVLENGTKDPDRVPLFCFVRASGYKVSAQTGYIVPKKPYLEVEYWNDGVQLDAKIAEEIIIDLFHKKYVIDNLKLNHDEAMVSESDI